MITNTHFNVVYPVIGASQMPRYEMKANSFMSDLRAETLKPEHTRAIAQKYVEDTAHGKHFADVAAAEMNWYDPPRGHIFDDWA